MQFAIIPPLFNLELMNQGKIIFSLGQLILRDEKYAEFIQQKIKEGWFTILDSGVGDHNDFIDNDTLIEIADMIRPSEVIALDVLFDGKATIESCKYFVDKVESKGLLGKFQIMMVPQGNNQDEWLEAYQFALDNSYINTIGFSKLSVPQCWMTEGYDNDQNVMQARHKCYDFLKTNELLKKPIHCLGAGNPIEFLHYANDKMMRSTDSCFSVLAAIHRYSWKAMQMTRVPTPKDYFTNYKLEDDQQLEIFTGNVEVLANMCNPTPLKNSKR